MRNRCLIILIVCLSAALFTASASAQDDPASTLITAINDLRRAYSVPELEIDGALMHAAQLQADWSVANNHTGHDGPGGNTPRARALAAGYGYGYEAQIVEKVSVYTMGLHTPSDVMDRWQRDWEYLGTIIKRDFEHIGVGYAEGTENSWFVVMLGWIDEKSPLAGTVPADGGGEPFPVSTPNVNGAVYHEVHDDETAWTIAAIYDIELERLYELNDVDADTILYTGMILVIDPGVSSTSLPEATAEVTPQPTKDSVAHETVEPVKTQMPDLPRGGISRRTVFIILLISGFAVAGVLIVLCVNFCVRDKRNWSE